MGPSLSPGETPELGHENASGLLRMFFYPFSQLALGYIIEGNKTLGIESLAELAFCIDESYQPWHCNLPSRQQSRRTTDFREDFKVASEQDYMWKTGHNF